jgi:hypothetical protein
MGGSGRGREIANGELANVSGLASGVVGQDGCDAMILSGLAMEAWRVQVSEMGRGSCIDYVEGFGASARQRFNITSV